MIDNTSLRILSFRNVAVSQLIERLPRHYIPRNDNKNKNHA